MFSFQNYLKKITVHNSVEFITRNYLNRSNLFSVLYFILIRICGFLGYENTRSFCTRGIVIFRILLKIITDFLTKIPLIFGFRWWKKSSHVYANLTNYSLFGTKNLKTGCSSIIFWSHFRLSVICFFINFLLFSYLT